MGWITALCAESGAGKSTLALYPHEKLGTIHHIVTEAVKSQLKVDPEWLGERVTTEQPGMDLNGQRLRGEDYYKSMITYAREKKDADTIILNSATGLSKLRYLDALHTLGGMPTEYRRENESAQHLAVHFLKELCDANKNSNIIVFYHLKTLYVEKQNPNGKGKVRELDTSWPETVGRKLDHSLGADFDAFLLLTEEEGKAEVVEIGQPPVMRQKYVLHFRSEKEARFIFTRTPAGVLPPAPMDITIKKAGDYAPLKGAWDSILKHVE